MTSIPGHESKGEATKICSEQMNTVKKIKTVKVQNAFQKTSMTNHIRHLSTDRIIKVETVFSEGRREPV